MQIFLLSCFLCCIYAQLGNQAIAIHPIPIVLRYPESNQEKPINLQYSYTDNDKVAESVREKLPLNEMNDFRINTRRYDNPVEVPYRIKYEDERSRNYRYQGRPSDFYSNFHDGASKNWQPLKQSEPRHKQPRYSRKDALSVHKSILMGDHYPQTIEAKRSPRVVKYIADGKGVALREDLHQKLQGSILGPRQRTRIVTAGSSPLMAKVVTSAIRVSNHQPVSDGKYMPQIIDLKIGK